MPKNFLVFISLFIFKSKNFAKNKDKIDKIATAKKRTKTRTKAKKKLEGRDEQEITSFKLKILLNTKNQYQ